MIDKAKMTALAAEYGVELTADQCEKLDIYAEMLVEHNKICNLTAITDPEGIMVKHFLDSLTALPMIRSATGGKVYSAVDVGTGAGFPGLVLAIADERMRITLLDSSRKRCDFLSDVCQALGIDAEVIHGRAEDAAHTADMRENFDIALSRAVASINVLAEYCIPFVRVGGCFVAHKGKNAETEIAQARAAFETVGAVLASEKTFTIPDGENSERTICVFSKDRPTETKYPRKPAKISKQPL